MRIVPLELPDIGLPTSIPEVPVEVYGRRLARLEAACEAEGLDALAIYADREHSANLAWLCGFDPRFEEALWLQPARRTPTLLVGNENLDYAAAALQLEAEIKLYQPFSLPYQDRSQSSDLNALLKRAGLERGMRLGLIGWKSDVESVPYWIVQALTEVTGSVPTNATSLLIDPDTGLRVVLEPEQVRVAEYAAALTSEGVKHLIFNLHEGMSEREAAQYLVSYGLELSCHPMLNFGYPISSGLKSPRNRTAQRGNYLQVAFGVIGGLTCRAGRLASASDTDGDDYLALIENYLQVVRSWYAGLRVGAAAGEVVAAATAVKDDSWDFALNPGHLIHLDEWASTPFVAGSEVALKSGYAVQQDIIPVPKKSLAMFNMEDGLVLADEGLREQLEKLDFELMKRCQQRRHLMQELGYQLSDDILPLSNLAGVFTPFMLEPGYVVTW